MPDTFPDLLTALTRAMRLHGGRHAVAEDITRQPMTYRQLFTRAFILSEKLPLARGDTNVGVLLPTSLGAMVTFVALHMRGKVPAMLNFSSGEAHVLHACRIACVNTVLTSRVFVEKGKLEPLVEALAKDRGIFYLEDVRKQLTLCDKLLGAAKALFPGLALRKTLTRTCADDPGVILYTSGSEGMPKGVALSHANILSNIAQVGMRLDLPPSDIVFNALPVFHSFGLTVGMLMPLVRGLKTFLYPSPLHYKQIPPLVRESGATIMLGTDTFYNGYARYAAPEDFLRVRLAVAGAEKLRDATRRHWLETFSVDILQGYGVTEASPVVSVNTPREHKPGTVGKIFPGIECRMEKVEGISRGGRLLIKGPNVMLGYLKADRPGVIQPQGEFYDTGDIVDIDADGFITILGRAKRFAKIAGEMVSLLAVEELAMAVSPDIAHAAVTVPDEKKGEQIVLYTEAKELTREQLLRQAQISGTAEISLPRRIVYMEVLPRLGGGKIDYVTLGKQNRS